MIALLAAHRDLIITAILLGLGAGMAALVVWTRPGCGAPLVAYVERTVSGIRYHRAGGRHAAHPDDTTVPMTTIPDGFAARTA